MSFFTETYAHFAPQHIAVLLFFLLAGCLMHRRFKSSTDKEKWLRTISLIPACLEAARDLLFLVTGRFKVGYLPLHLCGQAIIAEAVHGRMRESKAKAVLGELLFTMFLPGAFAALLFPDWNATYPLFSYYSFSGYTTHFFLVMYIILLYSDNRISISISHCWHGIVYLLAVALILYPINRLLGTNFLFETVPTAPFDVIWYHYGYGAYVMVFLLAGFAMVLLMYGIDYFYRCFLHLRH